MTLGRGSGKKRERKVQIPQPHASASKLEAIGQLSGRIETEQLDLCCVSRTGVFTAGKRRGAKARRKLAPESEQICALDRGKDSQEEQLRDGTSRGERQRQGNT